MQRQLHPEPITCLRAPFTLTAVVPESGQAALSKRAKGRTEVPPYVFWIMVPIAPRARIGRSRGRPARIQLPE